MNLHDEQELLRRIDALEKQIKGLTRDRGGFRSEHGLSLVGQNMSVDGTLSWSDPLHAYTPTWVSSGTQPAIGNGLLTGRYVKIGSLQYIGIILIAGSTTSFGTGAYRFSLPFSMNWTYAVGMAFVVDQGTRYYTGIATPVSTTQVAVVTEGNAILGATSPFTMANTDEMKISMITDA